MFQDRTMWTMRTIATKTSQIGPKSLFLAATFAAHDGEKRTKARRVPDHDIMVSG
jgi:hypothetical protein